MGRKPKGDSAPLLTWRNALEQAILNDDQWSANVVIIEPAGSEQDHIYLENFEEFAKREKRFVIKNICKSETIFMINQLGSDNRTVSESNKIFEEAYAYIKEKTDIPAHVLALVIKHLIIKMKEDDLFIKLQKLVVKEGISRESHTMIGKTEVRGTVSVKASASPVSSDKRNQTGNETFELDDEKKYNTLLRTRGEEWRDKAYVEDYPVDGPALYIIITNFQDPYLPTCLARILVPIKAVIQVRIELPISDIPAGLIKPNKRGQVEVQSLLQEQAFQFWINLLWFRINVNTSESLKHSAFIVFSPPYWNWQNLSADPEKIYDELCFLVYDVQDLSRQHANFLDNIELIEIPTTIHPEGDIKNYKQRINELPLESVTIYSILDSILETVRNPDLKIESTVDTTSYNDDERGGLELVASVVNKVFKTLDENSDQRKSYRTTKGDELENLKDPIVINKGDIAKYTTFHLGNIGLDHVVESSLRNMPLHQLWSNFDPQGEENSAKVSYHVNVLLSCFERNDIETAELIRLLHILSCKVLYNNRSSLQEPLDVQSTISKFKNVYLKRSIMAEPIKRFSGFDSIKSSNSPNVPYIRQFENSSGTLMSSVTSDFEVQRTKSLFNCPDISELVTPEEIEHEIPLNHLIDDFIYFEDFKGTSAYQVLGHSYNIYNCVNYKYCEVTDCIVMMFFNNFDEFGILREEWRCHIPTSVCLQDFFDFVLEEHYDWVQEEEKKYNIELNMYTDSSHKSVFETAVIPTCTTQEDVNDDMLMEDSLKYKELMSHDDESFDASSSGVYRKRLTQDSPPLDIPPKNVKTSKKAAVPSIHVESLPALEPVKKPFSGYDLGDRRVEVFGKDSFYYGKDGTQIFTNYYLLIPSNYEWVTLKVAPGKTLNQIWVHRVLGDVLSDAESEVSESFRISCKNGLLMNFKKTTYEIPIIPETESKLISNKDKHPSSPFMDDIPPKSTYYHSINITWPNGLFIKTVHLEHTPTISHIKLTYLRPIPSLNEKKRCISLNGEVIIFKSSGDIEVLKPDSTYIKITKCEKVPVVVPTSEDQSSTSSIKKSKSKSDKPKSGKGKAVKQEPAEPVPVENETYQYVIEDYMMISPNGDYENYIKNQCVGGQRLLIRTATDYNLGEVFSRRLDGTNILINSEGQQIATFPNGTRIICKYVIEDEEIYPEWSEEELANLNDFNSIRTIKEEYGEEPPESEGYLSIHLIYTVEHKKFPTVMIDKLNGFIKVNSPNGTSVTVDFDNRFDMTLDESTTAKFYGENLEVNYNICPKCKYDTKFEIKLTKKLESLTDKPADQWMEMKDYLSNIIVVAEEGGMEKRIVGESHVSEAENINCDYVSPPDSRASSSLDDASNVCCKCDDLESPPSMRFFVMNRGLNCSELVREDMISKTKEKYENNPGFSCDEYDTFGDYRTLISILSPIDFNESDKWLMDSALSDKPQNLTFKDLKVDEGKGFYHWMRPYERFVPKHRKPPSVLPVAPRAYKLRTLEQQFSKKNHMHLKGAKELIQAILKYRKVIAVDSETILNVPIIDNRTREEIKADKAVQKIAAWVYEDLKHSISDAAEKRAKHGITTRPIPIVDDGLVGDEASEVLYPLMVHEKDVQSDLDDVVPMSPALKRYWRRRREELKEEQFYQYLLRENTVPPYFKNILGGAIWWEVNNLVGKSVNKSERKKTICVCDENTYVDTESTNEEKYCDEQADDSFN